MNSMSYFKTIAATALLALASGTYAASPTGEAFSKQIMLGVKVSTNNMTDAPEKEVACINALPDTVLADAFDGVFDGALTQAERAAANEHYNSILAKNYFDLFAERVRLNNVNDPEMTQQYLMQHNAAEIRYMNAFAQSELGKKTMSVLQQSQRMQPVKSLVLSKIMECRQLAAGQ